MKHVTEYILNQISLDQISEKDALQMIKELKGMKAGNGQDEQEIAIIGLAGRYPEANNLDQFWANLVKGVDSVRSLPLKRRLDLEEASDLIGIDPHDVDYFKCAYLDRVDLFDAEFFNISPAEAKFMDPQQRIFLEVVWEALENAGISRDQIYGTNTGVYVGYAETEYKDLIQTYEPAALPGTISTVIANRISYLLNLSGPSLMTDTGCSSSLVALHQACISLQKKECEMAIVGGVSMILFPFQDQRWYEIGIGSRAGRSKAFDSEADGTGSGEGFGAVILKPLSKAIADGDHIYAVVKGSAVNNDGYSNGITAPNALAQEAVIKTAWKRSGVNPETISYIEAHGTGTPLGDPIELEGLTRAFRSYTKAKEICGIGSVKTNIGHLGSGAGMAGLIKTVLAMFHQQIPASLHYNNPNPFIDLNVSPIYVNDRLQEWPEREHPRRAGVSSFGLGGTNCHLLLEEYRPDAQTVKEERSEHIFTLSAKTNTALNELVEKYLQFFEKNADLNIADVCYTANCGRNHYPYRLAVVVKDMKDLRAKLGLFSKVQETQKEQEIYYSSTVVDQNTVSGSGPWSCCAELAEEYMTTGQIDWKEYYHSAGYRKVPLPTYPFQSQRHWISDKSSTADDWFYQVEWKESELPTLGQQVYEGVWLVFVDDLGVGEQLIKELSPSNLELIQIRPGESFAQISDNSYQLNPKEQSDYDRLLDSLSIEKRVQLSGVIHLWSCMSKEPVVTDLQQLLNIQDLGIYSLFHLTQSLLRFSFERPLELRLVSNFANLVTGEEEQIYPTHGALWGLAKVIPQEYDKLKVYSLDLDIEEMDLKRAADQLIVELTTNREDIQVAYRKQRRYLPKLKQVAYQSFNREEITIRSGGTYLVAGGAGGIGLEVCKYMADREKVNLVVINRSFLPNKQDWANWLEQNSPEVLDYKKVQALHEIENTGSTVDYYAADITDYEQMRTIIQQVKEKYGQIHGVINTTGVPEGGFIIRHTQKDFASAIAAKVEGTWVLDQVTQNDKLDFFVLFSSLTALTGDKGVAGYTAGNAFQDAYVAYRKLQGKTALTINWGVWDSIGMAEEHDQRIAQLKQAGIKLIDFIKPMAPLAACRAFEKALLYQGHQLIIANSDSGVLKSGLDLKDFSCQTLTSEDSLAKQVVQAQSTETQQKLVVEEEKVEFEIAGRAHDEEYSEAETMIAAIWAQVLGLKQVDIYADFFEMGGNSLFAHKLLKLLNNKFNDFFEIADFFSYSTVASLAEYLEQNQSSESKEGEDDSDLMELLAGLEKGELSVEEATKRYGDQNE